MPPRWPTRPFPPSLLFYHLLFVNSFSISLLFTLITSSFPPIHFPAVSFGILGKIDQPIPHHSQVVTFYTIPVYAGLSQVVRFYSEPLLHSLDEVQVIAVIYGFILGFGCFVVTQAVAQARKFSFFALFIWCAIFGNFACSTLGFLYLSEVLGPSTSLFACGLFLWASNTHFVTQIVVNRISLIWSDPRHIKLLKWGLFAWMCLIQISVFCIWLPARMEVSEKFIEINKYWDRVEKILILLTEASLNAIFILTVKSTLVRNGLTKYDRLVRFNIKMMLLSLAMDLVIIGTMFMKNSFTYVLIQPLVAMIKLSTELEMSRLIVKVVRAQHGLKFIEQTISQPARASRAISQTDVAPQNGIHQDVKNAKQCQIEDQGHKPFSENTPSSVENSHQWQPTLQIQKHVSSIHFFQPNRVSSDYHI